VYDGDDGSVRGDYALACPRPRENT
jgi:hypothetical protein